MNALSDSLQEGTWHRCRYQFEVDETSPEVENISLLDGQLISLADESVNTETPSLLLPLGSSLSFNLKNSDETVIEIWDWNKTTHYDTMYCGSGICDKGHKLFGYLTLVIYTRDEVGNESDSQEIKVSPFGFTAVRGTQTNSTSGIEKIKPQAMNTQKTGTGIVMEAQNVSEPAPWDPPRKLSFLQKFLDYLSN